MTLDPDRVEEHAVRILATLDRASNETLRGFRDALEGAGLPASIFGGMIATLLCDRVHGVPADRLTVMRMSSALRQALACGGGRFADRLEDAESPFWVAVREALLEMRSNGTYSGSCPQIQYSP